MKTPIALDDEESDDAEQLDSTTDKPSVKGRAMYKSGRIQYLEFSSSPGSFFFRCNMLASMEKSMRYPVVQVDSMGGVRACRCQCKARADQRCCHVAGLLFCLEDIHDGNVPSLSPAGMCVGFGSISLPCKSL